MPAQGHPDHLNSPRVSKFGDCMAFSKRPGNRDFLSWKWMETRRHHGCRYHTGEAARPLRSNLAFSCLHVDETVKCRMTRRCRCLERSAVLEPDITDHSRPRQDLECMREHISLRLAWPCAPCYQIRHACSAIKRRESTFSHFPMQQEPEQSGTLVSA